jgi:hypothetical protein
VLALYLGVPTSAVILIADLFRNLRVVLTVQIGSSQTSQSLRDLNSSSINKYWKNEKESISATMPVSALFTLCDKNGRIAKMK